MSAYLPVIQGFTQGFLTAAGVVLAAWLTTRLATTVYGMQKRIDREEELRKKRADDYELYIRALLKRHTATRAKDNQLAKMRRAWNDYEEARWNLFLTASDDVLKRVNQLNWHISRPRYERYDEDYKQLYAAVLDAMRRDSYQQTNFSVEVISRMLPLKSNEVYNLPPEEPARSHGEADK